MKLYVSQPMRGLTKAQIQTRRKEIVDNYKRRYKPEEEPDIIDNIVTNIAEKSRIFYLSKSIAKLDGADVVLFSKDYAQADECCVEFQVASRFSKTTIIEK